MELQPNLELPLRRRRFVSSPPCAPFRPLQPCAKYQQNFCIYVFINCKHVHTLTYNIKIAGCFVFLLCVMVCFYTELWPSQLVLSRIFFLHVSL